LNLHSVVSSAIGAINPNQFVGVRSSIGNSVADDGSVSPAYATPGSLAASIGGTFTASASGTTLTVSAVLSGSLQEGDAVSGTDGVNSLPVGCVIAAWLTGTPGGIGTYQISSAPAGGVLNSCTVTSLSTVLNVSAVIGGVLQPGQDISDVTAALLAGTLITGQISGVAGGIGLYSINQQQTVTSEAMTTSMTIVAQVQALSGSDLRHMDALNLQGSHRSLYASVDLRSGVRVKIRGGDLVILPSGSTWLVNQGVEPWYSSAGWVKCVITLQDGS
jgi:hypothetical protein